MNYRAFLDGAKPLDMVKFTAVRPIYQPMKIGELSKADALPTTVFEVEKLTMSGALLYLDQHQCKVELISGVQLVIYPAEVTEWHPR